MESKQIVISETDLLKNFKLYEETRPQRKAFEKYKGDIDELMYVYKDRLFLEFRNYNIEEKDELIISALT